MFEDYKRKRLAEMRTEEKKGRWGSLMPLGREDFVKEVTEGSKMGPDGVLEPDPEDDDEEEARAEGSKRMRGTGIVVFLFKDL